MPASFIATIPVELCILKAVMSCRRRD